MTIEIYSSKQQHILYDADHLSQIDGTFFDPEYWKSQSRLTEPSGGRGQAFFIDHPNGFQYLLRHYRRGGLAAKISQDKYWFSGLENSRPFQEFRLTHELFTAGLPVPQPLAARVCRSGLFYQGDLMTLKIPQARPFAKYLLEPEQHQLWQNVGSVIARFHKWGLNHIDLNTNNILVDDKEQIWIIDFDRCEKMPVQGPWMEENLLRLKRSILKLTKEQANKDLWQSLIQAYTTSLRSLEQ